MEYRVIRNWIAVGEDITSTSIDLTSYWSWEYVIVASPTTNNDWGEASDSINLTIE